MHGGAHAHSLEKEEGIYNTPILDQKKNVFIDITLLNAFLIFWTL